MNRETSIYLDLTRFVAALTVFLGHVSGQRLTGGFLWQFGPFMAEAVAIFFVLSGFVIGYVADSKENTPSVFAINRAARCGPIFITRAGAMTPKDRLGHSSPVCFSSTNSGRTGFIRARRFPIGRSVTRSGTTSLLRSPSSPAAASHG